MAKNNTLVKSAYKADIAIGFSINESSEPIPIAYERIKYVIIDDNFEDENLPIIYLGLSCTKQLYNAVVDNEKNAKFNLEIKIYNAKTNMPLKHNSNIAGEFTYVVSTNNPNFYEDLSNSKTVGDRGNSYIQLVVGLTSMTSMNTLRTPVNNIMETDVFTFLTMNINKMKYAMSELDNNEEIETLVASPKSTIVSAINELTEQSPFYNTNTRLFADFDKLYLLKTDGSYTDAQDGDAEGFIFKIAKVTTSSSYNEGLYSQEGAYVVDVNPGMVNIIDNSSMDRICNNLVSVDQLKEESIKALALEVQTDSDAETRTKYMYTQHPERYKNMAESNTATLEIVKDDIDMSLITPNKTYRVSVSEDMGPEYSKYDDTYTLVYKKVVLRNFNGDFTMSVNIGLRKIGNITPTTSGAGGGQSASKKYSSSKNSSGSKSPSSNNSGSGGTNTTTRGGENGEEYVRPKRLFYQPKRKVLSPEEKLPPVKHLKGVSLQREFKKFDEYYG